MNNSLKKNDSGSALIVAIVCGVVVMTFSLMLLMTAYSLFSTANGQQADMSGRELSQSIADELANELCIDFPSPKDMETAMDLSLNNIWFFVRYNIWQQDEATSAEQNWRALNDSYGLGDFYRYFKLKKSAINNANIITDIDEVEDVTVRLSWKKAVANGNSPEGTRLYLSVIVKDKGAVYEAERTFILHTERYEIVDEDKEGEIKDDELLSGEYPDGEQSQENPELNNEDETTGDENSEGEAPEGETPDGGNEDDSEPNAGNDNKPEIKDITIEDYNKTVTGKESINPYGHKIYYYEKWSWSLNG